MPKLHPCLICLLKDDASSIANYESKEESLKKDQSRLTATASIGRSPSMRLVMIAFLASFGVQSPVVAGFSPVMSSRQSLLSGKCEPNDLVDVSRLIERR